MTSVDVVVPCYNYAHYLETCVAGVLNQRDVEVRVLIIDDVSPDNTPEVAARITASDARVSYVRNETNLGLIGVANRGVMDWATADYVVLLSADDVLAPGSLARATRLMEANPDIAMTYGMALMLSDDGPELALADPGDAPCQVIPGKAFIHRVFVEGNPVPTPCAVMRTSVQHRIGGYDPMFKHTSDVDTWMRAAAVGSIGVVNAVQGLYRWHASNMSAAFQRRPIGDRREMILTCREFERRHADKIPEVREWMDQMERRFGEEALWIASTSYEVLGDDTWEDTLSFAKQYYPRYRTSKVWWKLLVKQILGRKAAGALHGEAKSRETTRAGEPAWHDHGMQIGWWPKASEL